MAIRPHRIYVAVTFGHLAIDMFNSMGPVLLTFLSVPLSLSTGQIGLGIGLYQAIAGLTQPPFGWLTDRIGSRWLGPISVAWTIGGVALSVYVADRTQNFLWFLLLYSLAALGSGAFHPQGTMHAGTVFARRAATAMAVFFLFGQGGLATGPILAGLLLDRIGPPGIYLLAGVTLPVALFMIFAMGEAAVVQAPPPLASPDADEAGLGREIRWGLLVLLALLFTFRGWAFMGTAFFLPKLFHDLGWSPTAYGAITGLFWLSAGLTGVLAGNLADRWGRRRLVFATLVSGSIGLFFLPRTDSWHAFLLSLIAGGLIGASHSILLVVAQALLPMRRALASGISLGYLFGIGALASWAIGLLADRWGLVPVIQANAAVGILAGLLTLVLPATRATPEAQPARVPA